MEMYVIKAKRIGFFVEKDPYKCELKIKGFLYGGQIYSFYPLFFEAFFTATIRFFQNNTQQVVRAVARGGWEQL